MNWRPKLLLLLLGVALPAAAAGLMVFMVHRQGQTLTEREVVEVEQILLEAKRAELRHHLDVARDAIAIAQRGQGDDDAARARALEILRELDFGPDGYFFVYDLRGHSLMHPRQPDLVGRDLWNLTDASGRPTIQRLVAQARAGGGFVEYLWQRPSQQRVSRKLGYVVPLPRWNWMVGSGIYLEDIDRVVAEIRRQSARRISGTMWLIAGVTALGTLVVVGCGLALNASEQRTARLRMLARQLAAGQEAERDRVSRELHDGVMQQLVSVRFIFESALARLPGAADQPLPALGATLVQGIERLNEGLEEIRRIAHDLRPLSGDADLPALLRRLGRAAAPPAGAEVRVEVQAGELAMEQETALALYRVAQEALSNVDRHAGARLALVRLAHDGAGATLTVTDDGRGFDVMGMNRRPGAGTGIANMRGRTEALGGRLSIRSAGGGTTVQAWVPLPSRAG